MKIKALALIASVGIIGSLSANDDLFSANSSDDLFGGSLIASTTADDTNLAQELLMNDTGIAFSGTFGFDITAQRLDSPNLSDDIQLSAAASGNLKLDARPDSDYRVLLNTDFNITEQANELSLREGFADAVISDGWHLRTGLQVIGWGVGYFFSPADNLSLNPIDATDPEADRSGTLAAKLQHSAGTDSYYAYLLPDTERNDVALAVKGEWLVAGSELGLGAIRHSDNSANAIATLTKPSNIGDFFAEYSATFGTQTTGLTEQGVVVDRQDTLLHQFTVGVSGDADIARLGSTRFALQYFYNGLGYDHTFKTDSPQTWAAIAPQAVLPELTGQHYGALSVNISDPFSVPVTLSALALSDLTDGSVMFSPKISHEINDHIKVSFATTQQWGKMGSSYAPMGDLATYSISLSLANQAF